MYKNISPSPPRLAQRNEDAYYRLLSAKPIHYIPSFFSHWCEHKKIILLLTNNIFITTFTAQTH